MKDRHQRFAALPLAALGAALLLLSGSTPALAQPFSPPSVASAEARADWWASSRPGLQAGDRQMEPQERTRRLVLRRLQTGRGFRLDLDLPLLVGGTRRETDSFYQAVIARFRTSMPELNKPLRELAIAESAQGTMRLEGFQSLGDLLSIEFLRDSPATGAGGGAGAGLQWLGVNWSFSLARELELRDIFRPGVPWLETLATACNDALRRRLPPERADRPPAWYRNGISPTESALKNWVVERDSLVILFDANDLTGQEEAGPQQVAVPFSQLVDLIDSRGPLGWAVADGTVESGCLNLSCHVGFPEDWRTVHPALGRGCQACHPPYLAGKLHLMKRPFSLTCYSCHDAMGEAVRGATSAHSAVREGKCVVCHDPHGINGRASHRLLKLDPVMEEGGGRLDVPASVVKFCTSCHPQVLRDLTLSAGPTDFRAGSRNLHMLHLRNEKLKSCLLCHDPHAAPRPHLLREAVPFGVAGESYPIDYRPTTTGGSCRPGCHREREFVRQ